MAPLYEKFTEPVAFWNLPVPPLTDAGPIALVEPSDANMKLIPEYENWSESPLLNVILRVPVASAVDILVALREPIRVVVAFPNGVAIPAPTAS